MGAIITLSAAVAANSAPEAISAPSRHGGLIVGRVRTAAGRHSAHGIIGHLVAAHAVHGRTLEVRLLRTHLAGDLICVQTIYGALINKQLRIGSKGGGKESTACQRYFGKKLFHNRKI